MSATESGSCPFFSDRTDSKTATMAARFVKPEADTTHFHHFDQLRGVLRNAVMRQNGAPDAPNARDDPMMASIFFLHGDAHRRRRGAISGFFTPKAIATRHLPGIDRTADALLAAFRAKGEARLDEISFHLTAQVVAEIVGLTETPLLPMMHRIESANGAPAVWRGGLGKLLAPFKSRYYAMAFYFRDVRPTVAARRRERRDDVISKLVDEGRSGMEIMVECMTFGLAGQGTTREFIVVAAWHMFDNSVLRQQFLAADEAGQTAILMEILRLEPQASMIYRTATGAVTDPATGSIAQGERLSLNVRAANLDEAVVGPDPARIDPERATKQKNNGAWMSFGDGAHFCPGWQLALAETRLLLDKLFRIPGVRLVRAPDMQWTPPMLQSYQLVNAVIACDRG